MAGAGKRRFNRTEKPRAGKKELAKWEAIKERRNRCFDRTKEHGSARIPGLPTEPFAGYDYLSGEGETITASHTEILTVPPEAGVVLATVKRAARRLRRWPAATLDRGYARRLDDVRPGRRNGPLQPNKETSLETWQIAVLQLDGHKPPCYLCAVHITVVWSGILPPRCLAWVVTKAPCLAGGRYLPRSVSWFG